MKQVIAAGADRYKTTCGECGCVFYYTREDVKPESWRERYRKRVACPHCGDWCFHMGHLATVKP